MCRLINTEISECGLNEILASDITELFNTIEDVSNFIHLEFYDKSTEKDTLSSLLLKFKQMQWYEACSIVENKLNNIV